ncbi:sperm motility kinase Z-like [Mesocricetus auratus]|uniref:non-specific serine/threonine protein kinase n=1 Tax=Mesocricetus auratus TaxID=10036 RepID=A0ABM2XUB3_MESAU|nr:sperm motility kinase Z-like [Mesocricetus auratus]XP_040606281.1 sperm motility kinase Z-like [Mesocricetus auratus]
MLEDICGSLLYWAPEILARKPYDGMAGDMWSLGIVLFVLVTGHFPYVEPTLDGMYRLITTTTCPIPYHLSKPCHIVIARLLMVPTWYRITIGQLVQRPWLGHIQEHVPPATKEILPRVVETMCTIGYTCEEIVSSLKHRQPSNVTATINILRYQLSCGDSHGQGKSWLNMIHARPLSLSLPLERRASEPTFPVGKSHFHKEDVEERAKGCRSYPMLNRWSCLEVMPWSDNTVLVGSAYMADAINTAAGDMDSVDSLPGSLSSHESALYGTITGCLNLGFSIEEPFMGPDISSDQFQVAPTTSGSRTFRKQIVHALRALCCCCCCCCRHCCLPNPRVETEMA